MAPLTSRRAASSRAALSCRVRSLRALAAWCVVLRRRALDKQQGQGGTQCEAVQLNQQLHSSVGARCTPSSTVSPQCHLQRVGPLGGALVTQLLQAQPLRLLMGVCLAI